MAERRVFGTTWWGKAWTDALQRRARLDANRLPRGRTYARHDRVQDIELSPGEINARVQGSRPEPYTVRVHIRRFSDDEWNVVLDAITARAAHTAALLDGELDPGIVEDARAVGVELLPTAGEVVPRCSCPDRAIPCKHSAAVCYLVADELDADPFALLRLRGRSRDEILAELRRRRAAGASPRPSPPLSVPDVDRGVPAGESWSRVLGRLPRPPARAPRAGSPRAVARRAARRCPLHRRRPPHPGRRRRRARVAHDPRRRPVGPGRLTVVGLGQPRHGGGAVGPVGLLAGRRARSRAGRAPISRTVTIDAPSA